ncbi:MAG: hypothetical protein KF708_03160 [Pirellulales bacterium]|nr:hypothetical protein [Pirellulales bacterium]
MSTLLFGAALSATAHAQVVLRTDFSKPAEYRTSETVGIDQKLNIAEQLLETSSEQTFEVLYSVGEKDATGLIPVHFKFETVKASIGLPGGISIDFDSKTDDGQDGDPPAGLLKGALRAIVGAELTAMINEQLRVQSFTGYSELLEKLSPEIKPLLASQFDEAILKSNLQMAIDRFPAEPVKPGDAWTHTQVMNLGQGQQMTFDEKLEYVGPVEKDGRQLEHVKMQANAVRYSIADNATLPFKLKESDLKVVSSTGDLYVDATTRRVVLREEKVAIKGKIVYLANNAELPALLDLTISTRHSEPVEPAATP